VLLLTEMIGWVFRGGLSILKSKIMQRGPPQV
jgi:hypothetical protein